MIITVRRRHPGHRPSPVSRSPETFRTSIYDVGICRISSECCVVEGPLDHGALIIYQHPILACVIGAIQSSSGFSLHEGVDTIWIRVRHSHVCFTDQFVGEAVQDVVKTFSAIGALVEAAFI